MISTKEVAARAVAALEDKKGLNIEILKIDEVTTLADYFIICTGTSNTHVNAMTNAVEAAMDVVGEPLVSREGHRSGTWVLLDYGSVVIHVFTEDTRKFYDLERLWSDAPRLEISEN
jgi:ribosome-associated protein